MGGRFITMLYGLCVIVAAVLALILMGSGLGKDLDRMAQNIRDGIFEKQASGDIHIVEVDARSLSAIGRWPWPRTAYADLVNKLDRGGVTQAVFDIDFSAPSNAADDAAFAQALTDSDMAVVLPTFEQRADNSGKDMIESLPIAPLRQQAALGAVNIVIDEHGMMNRYLYGVTTDGVPRPSLASWLSNSSGEVNQSFAIDQSIDPASVPRHSFIDVVEGRVDPAVLAGKQVIIGNSAVELGDFHVTARHGLIPGVVIQALAAETLKANMDVQGISAAGPLVMAIIFSLMIIYGLRKRTVTRRIGMTALFLALVALPTIFQMLRIADVGVTPALAYLVVLMAGNRGIGVFKAFLASRERDEETGLPNLQMLQRKMANMHDGAIAVANITNFSQLGALMSTRGRCDLMRRVAERLEMVTAESLIYRIDSDQLAWIIPMGDIADIDDRFNAAAALLRSSIIAGDRSVKATAHFGMAHMMREQTAKTISQASLAAEKAAAKGLRWAVHDDSISEAAENTLAVLLDLDQALENEDLWVSFQPKWDLAEDRVIGAEALVRWDHPEKGPIRPDHFIPVLEDENRIGDLTLYVMRRVIDQVAMWNMMGHNLNVAVNVSAKLLSDNEYCDQILGLINSDRIAPDQLTIEVTESAALETPERAITTLQKIKLLGARVSVDDYGTGHSTLSYLQSFPADEIKIDQMFVRGMAGREADRVMVRSTIDLAHALSFKVVAEGVEDLESMQMLKSYGCDVIQGWHIGKAVNAETFAEQWLNNTDSDLAVSA